MASTTLQINHDFAAADLASPASDPLLQAQKLEALFSSLQSGAKSASLEIISDSTSLVRATGTLTCATVIANNTCAINGVTLTAKASPVGQDEFLVAASNTLQAVEIARAINAHTSLNGVAYATSSGAVVTVQAHLKGKMGNAISLAGTVTVLAASGTKLASGAGADDSPVSFSLGK